MQPPPWGQGTAGAVASGRRGLCLVRCQPRCPGTVGMPSQGDGTASPPCSRAWRGDAGQQGASGVAEIQGDFDVVTTQGQGDCRQPGLLHNGPPADPPCKGPAGTLHGQPQSGAAGAAAGPGTMAAPTSGWDVLPAATSGEESWGQGSGKRSRWQRELLEPPGVLTCGVLSAPGHRPCWQR